MNIKNYLYPLIRWWWLLVISTLVAGVASYIVASRQPPIYSARTTLMIGRAIEDPNPTNNQFYLSQQLAATYADIANRDIVRNATMEALGWEWIPNYQARALPNSQLIEISVVDTNPERAQVVANELANQLVRRSPTSESPEDQARQEFVLKQLDTLEIQIEQTQEDIERLQAELGNLVSARQINETENQIAGLQTKLNTLQSNYANLLVNTRSGAVNTLAIIEPAGIPSRPIGPAKEITVILAAAIGLVLAAGASYLLEYIDDTVKSQEDVRRKLDAPILGFIPDVDNNENGEIFVAKHPRHPFSEAFRSLRTNIGFVGVDDPLKTIFISSSDTGEGKTSVAINLAAIMAQGEKKVLIVDADLRRPNVHNYLGVPNGVGLSDVFLNQTKLEDVIQAHMEGGFFYITAGKEPPNPAELLGSKRMTQILEQLREKYDAVVLDGPPFVVTDAPVMAAKADGVLIVVRPGYSRQPGLESMREQLQLSTARIVGVVLNRIRAQQGYYYGKTYAASEYYSGEQQSPSRFSKKNMEKGWSVMKVAAGSTRERAQKLGAASREKLQKAQVSFNERTRKKDA